MSILQFLVYVFILNHTYVTLEEIKLLLENREKLFSGSSSSLCCHCAHI